MAFGRINHFSLNFYLKWTPICCQPPKFTSPECMQQSHDYYFKTREAKFSSKNGLLIHSVHKDAVQQKSTELKLWNNFANLEDWLRATTWKFEGILNCGLTQAPRVLLRSAGLEVSRREAAKPGLLHCVGKSGRVKLVPVRGDSEIFFLTLVRKTFCSVVQTERLRRVRKHSQDYM